MPTTRRSFIKQSVSAATTGLLLPNVSSATDDPPECIPPSPSDLRPDPHIRLVFSGLLIYQFVPGNPAFCLVSPLKNISDHIYSVVLWVKDGHKVYRSFEHFDEPKNQFTLNVQGAREGVVKYTPRYRPTDPIDRNRNDYDCHDWRWILNVREFLEANEQDPRFDLWPGIKILNGRFYTSTKTNKAQIGVTRKWRNDEKELYSVGSVAAANIYFDDGITGASLDVGGSEIKPMPKLDNVRYELHVDYRPKSSGVPTTTGGRRSTHFHRYNDKMILPKPRRLYEVIYYERRSQKLLDLEKLATPDVPCMGLEARFF